MASCDPATSKRLIASILQFLESEAKRPGLTEEQEQIEVACQCLQAAYTTTSADVPATQKQLSELFLEACPAPEIQVRELTEDEKTRAENFKVEGNGYMKNGAFDEAIESYNKAINIDSRNAVYYCNRAAAQTGKLAYDKALTDCKKALEIDSEYSKAYSRMGLTYSKMESYDAAIECYEKALQLDPENEGYKKNLKIAKDKAVSQTTSNGADGVGMPGMPGMGQLGGFAEMMQNPAFMNMAKQVMDNPAMKEMAQQLMGKLMGGEGQTGDQAGPPAGLANLMNMGQQFAQQMSEEHPEVLEQMRAQMEQNNDGAPPAE